MRLIVLSLFIALVLFLQPGGAAELPKLDAGVPIDLEADQLDFDKAAGVFHAEGKARLSQGALQLTSEQIWWNQQTGEVEAAGDVHLRGAGETLTGKRIVYNLQQGTGVIEEGEAYWQEKSLRISGRRLERLGSDHFRIHDGHFTLCEGDSPAWALGAKQADVKIGSYLTAKHALFYIKDVPSFYLPYMVLPIKTERESGFLMPSFGYSDRRGTKASFVWYQVLGPHMDATFYLDHLSRLGTGTGIEYRYLFRNHKQGKIKAYSVFAQEGDDHRMFEWQHSGPLSDSLRLVVDAKYVKERDYFADYAEVVGEYNEQKLVSSIFLAQRWEKASMTAQYKSIKDLEEGNPTPWQRAPMIDFSIAPRRLGQTPFFVGLRSSYTDFRRDEGATGRRLNVEPTLGLHRHLIQGLEFDSEYSYRQREYFDLDEGLDDSSGSSALRARLASRLYKVYGGGEKSWLHSVEPEMIYQIREANLGPELPDFDLIDQNGRQHSLGYALVSRLRGKWQGAEGSEKLREVAWLKISQDYSFSQPRGADRFNDLRVQMILRPTELSSMAVDLNYDTNLGRVLDLAVDASISTQRENRLGVSYHKTESEGELEEIENLNFLFDVDLLKPVYLHYEQRYDFLKSSKLEQVVSLDLRQQCWGIKMTLREREEERSVMFTVTLNGIGGVGR